MGVSEGEQAGRLPGCLDEGDRIRQMRRMRVLAMRVVFAQAAVHADPLAQELAGGGDHLVHVSDHRLRSLLRPRMGPPRGMGNA